MIMDSFGRYFVETIHDHETQRRGVWGLLGWEWRGRGVSG